MIGPFAAVWTVIRSVAMLPLASVPTLQKTAPPTMPWLGTAAISIKPAGSGSATTTFVAVPGP